MMWHQFQDPNIAKLYFFDLFADDPAPEPIPPGARYAAYDPAHDRIYLPVEFIGTPRLRDAILRLATPHALVPVAENERGLFIALDWVEQNLAELDRVCQVIRQRVKENPPPV
jgi:hypothetical protein